MASRLTGNRFWELRTKHGRDRIFSDPAVLWEEACLYFDWADRTSLYRSELVKYQGDADIAEVPLQRMFSMNQFTLYLGVSGAYFRTAKNQLKEKIEKGTATAVEVELLETIERIEQVVHVQQIEGAAVGLFNANFISRINGIADNTNVTNGDPVVRIAVGDQETADSLDEIESLL